MRSGFEQAAAALAVAAFGSLLSRASLGQESFEPTYGRVSGDVCWVAGAGAAVASRGARAEGELRLRYLDSAGVFATYEDSLLARASAEPRRVISGGAELRPLFLYRWLRGLETQRSRLDLAIDSLGLELGAFLAAPSTAPSDFRPGFELGLGIEFPFETDATGPWVGLHGGVRWADQPSAQGSTGGPDARAAYLTVTLAWHQVVRAHIVELHDERPQ
jgi:hypothetical protein